MTNNHSAPTSNEQQSTTTNNSVTATSSSTNNSNTLSVPINSNNNNPSPIVRKLSNSGTTTPQIPSLPPPHHPYYSVPPGTSYTHVPPPSHHQQQVLHHHGHPSSSYYTHPPPPYAMMNHPPYASYLPPPSSSGPTTSTTTMPSSTTSSTANSLQPQPTNSNAMYYSPPHYPLYPTTTLPHQQPPPSHPTHSIYASHQPIYSGTPPTGTTSVMPPSHPTTSVPSSHPIPSHQPPPPQKQSKKKKKSKSTTTVASSGSTAIISSCPTDPLDISRRLSGKIDLIEGFTMDRILQRVVILPQDDNGRVISEKQTVKIDSSLRNQYSTLKLIVWLCEMCVDKITDNISPVRSLYEEVVGSNNEISVQDLMFPTTIFSSGRKAHFLRFVLYDMAKETEMVAFCDTCPFEIRSRQSQVNTATTSTSIPTQNIPVRNNYPFAVPSQKPLPILPSATVVTSETPSSTVSVGEKPTLDFLKRLVSTATLSEDINSWDNFMHTLNQLVIMGDSSFLNTSSGSFSKRADVSDIQATKELMMRGQRKNTCIYPYIEQCYPAFGPARGGIQISINVKDLNMYDEDDLTVTFDDIKVPKTDFVSIRPNKILLYLPALPSNHILGKVDVAISVRNELEDFCHVLYDAFEYLNNDVFEKKKSSIPTPIERPSSSRNKNISQVLIRPLSDSNGVNEDLMTKNELYNSDTAKYITSIYFEPGFLKGSPLEPAQRFIWLLRKSETFENLVGHLSSKEIDCGGVLSIRDMTPPTLKQSEESDILEIPIEIDRRICSEKYNCTMVLQLYDVMQKQVHYTSRPFSILQKPPKSVAYSSFNEDERVLQLLEKIKTPKARKTALRGGALDPTLNYLGQTKTHIACLSGNDHELKRHFQPAHLVAHDLFLRNPLHLAFASGNIEAAKFCIDHLTTSPHLLLLQRDYYHHTPFHLALKFNRTHFMKEICLFLKSYLIKYSVQQQQQQSDHTTAASPSSLENTEQPSGQNDKELLSSQKKRKSTTSTTNANVITPSPPRPSKKRKQSIVEEDSSDDHEQDDDVLVVEDN
ncbi:hypothetical protein FDP41_013512 [Naegleria fowleri]|uniref:Uncharacterized protein n=1 Tax=Naegleria fowleri TaxID=5763 RepID=A0A6A5C351_NAEFO|nr:uncharacterized protein FDP41_013512 [Naegleria fowleri]KAF0980298.1 hypothetical protein FDP41_013512 [Naegleria fowleri]CAG4717666.1 unnamed protein product [Naegleria fowleri]